MRDLPEPSLAIFDREYVYDAALNLTAANDDAERLKYVVNGNRQVVSVSQGRELREHYCYDASGYVTQRHVGTQQPVAHEEIYGRGHRLRHSGNRWFEYDAAGRMTSRREQREGYRAEHIRFQWDSRNQLTGLIKGADERWHYVYDALGRRISKTCEQKGLRTTYVWDGDTVAEIREYRDGELQRIRHQVFNGWELLAQQEWRAGGEGVPAVWETCFAVCAPTGQPLALFNPAGKQAWWQGPHSLWGMALTGYGAHNRHRDPGLGFAGQQSDEESGLSYNRFRYYDAESACYLSPDPIGLAGGLNSYAYVKNPLTWIDPLGLTSCQLSAAMEKIGTPRPANSAAHHIVPETAKGAQPARNILNKHGIDINGPDNGVFLPNRNNTDGMSGVLHNDKHPDDYISAINNRIKAADELEGKQGVLDELNNINDILSSTNRNSSWYTILL